MKWSLASSVLRSNFENVGGNLEFAHEICMDLVILTLCTLCQVVMVISTLIRQILEKVSVCLSVEQSMKSMISIS